MGWLVRRILRNAISSLVTPANVERCILLLVGMLYKLPVVGDQIKSLLEGTDFGTMSEKLSAEILDWVLPLLPQVVGNSAGAMAALGSTEKEADDSIEGDCGKLTLALAEKVGK